MTPHPSRTICPALCITVSCSVTFVSTLPPLSQLRATSSIPQGEEYSEVQFSWVENSEYGKSPQTMGKRTQSNAVQHSSVIHSYHGLQSACFYHQHLYSECTCCIEVSNSNRNKVRKRLIKKLRSRLPYGPSGFGN